MGARYNPQTQGKIERYHRSIKNVINLQNYYLPGELEQEITRFVEYYNNHRYHESLNNLTHADVFYGRDRKRLLLRERIKHITMKSRRKYNMGKGGLKKQLLLTKKYSLTFYSECPTCFEDVQYWISPIKTLKRD